MNTYIKKDLERLILKEKLSYIKIGNIYNVSGNAIKKAALKLGIELPKRRVINKAEFFNNGVTLADKIPDTEFIEIINKFVRWKDIVVSIGYKTSGSTVKKNILRRCKQLNITPNISKVYPVLQKTKEELFSNRKNWQSARGSIQRNAREIYFNINPSPVCVICGYKNHIEVAHVKAVSAFANDIPISIINSIDNLIGLCPNHHWEYDNNLVIIP